jgi:hypothetical protein
MIIGLLLAGLVMAGLWRFLTPFAADLGDEQEASAAVDGTLALLGVAAGVVTGVIVLVRPGPRPALRSITAIGGSVVAGAISWQLGDLLGTPALAAVGAAFTWPVATAVALFVGAMLPGTSRRLNASMPPPPVGPIEDDGGFARGGFGADDRFGRSEPGEPGAPGSGDDRPNGSGDVSPGGRSGPFAPM